MCCAEPPPKSEVALTAEIRVDRVVDRGGGRVALARCRGGGPHEDAVELGRALLARCTDRGSRIPRRTPAARADVHGGIVEERNEREDLEQHGTEREHVGARVE